MKKVILILSATLLCSHVFAGNLNTNSTDLSKLASAWRSHSATNAEKAQLQGRDHTIAYAGEDMTGTTRSTTTSV